MQSGFSTGNFDEQGCNDQAGRFCTFSWLIWRFQSRDQSQMAWTYPGGKLQKSKRTKRRQLNEHQIKHGDFIDGACSKQRVILNACTGSTDIQLSKMSNTNLDSFMASHLDMSGHGGDAKLTRTESEVMDPYKTLFQNQFNN